MRWFMKDKDNGEKKEQAEEKKPDETAKPEEKKKEEPILLLSNKEKREASELEKCRHELKEYKEKNTRTMAEMDNLVKRLAKEKDEFTKFASAEIMRKIIPVLDSFEAALRIEPEKEDKKYYEGVKHILNNLVDILKKEGLERQAVLGQKLDPLKHEVVGTIDTDEDKKDNVIQEELRAGYLLKGAVLRPAMVKTFKKKPKEETEKK
jgi:molecular chaperone GrpE